MCLLAIASFFPLQNFTDDVLQLLGPFAPRAAIDIIRQEMVKIGEGKHGGLLTVGVLGALWSSSSAMVSMINALNRTYDITESRPWWRVRLTAILLTISLSLLIVLSAALIVAGPEIADVLARHFAFGSVFVWTWRIAQWPLAFAMVVVAIDLIYHFAPDAEQDWVWATPGSVAATTLWVIGSLGFRYYAVNFGNYEAAYGTVGGVILLLLWLYLSGLVIVIGGEMNAQIEYASPWSTVPAETIPGERRKLGAAAARAYHERKPSPVVAPNREKEPSAFEKAAAYIAAFAMWRFLRRSDAP